MESLFNATSLRIYIPETSSISESLFDPNRSLEDVSRDWDKARSGTERDVAFFDEKLIYYLALFVPNEALGYLDGEPEVALASLVKRIQRTMTSSFLPPIPPQNSRTNPHSRLSTDPSLSHLTLPTIPGTPNTPGVSADPATPNPFPAMRGGEEEYADVEGVTVWEGEVGSIDPTKADQGHIMDGKKDGRTFSRVVEGGYEVIWEGEVPVAYVRTQIQNPLLALTASITLRPDANMRASHRAHNSVATLGDGDVGSDGEDEEGDEGEELGDAGMVDIDLLGGLAGGTNPVPASRLGPSARHDLSLPDPHTGRPVPLSAITPRTAPHHSIPSTATSGPKRATGDLPSHLLPLGSTMRKSFRRVLSLSPGLRVRMRNLVLPQLIPPPGSSHDTASDDMEGDEGEKKVVLCVEIENAPDGVTPPVPFKISRVDVEIGGKGGKATAVLTCQPKSTGDLFPLHLESMEQYNLLYGVTVASTTEESGGNWEDDQAARAVLRNLGTGEVNRPVSIMVIGRPYYLAGDKGEEVCPTREFSSRWNCNLDLTTYYAGLAAAAPPPIPIPSAITAGSSRQRISKPIGTLPPTNAIVGDKRYSLATLLAGDNEESTHQLALQQQQQGGAGAGSRPSSLPPSKRIVSGKPLMPSQIANQAQNRQPSRSAGEEKSGLMISVRLLDGALRNEDGGKKRTVKPLEEFSVEVYVNNRTEEVRRFRLSIPSSRSGGRESVGNGGNENALRHTLQSQSTSAPGVIPLENDIRCGPLLPGASMSARLRFMALREGVHRIEKLRVTGVGDDVDFIVSPVLDVVVGSGVE